MANVWSKLPNGFETEIKQEAQRPYWLPEYHATRNAVFYAVRNCMLVKIIDKSTRTVRTLHHAQCQIF
jgi:hypothetical protein